MSKGLAFTEETVKAWMDLPSFETLVTRGVQDIQGKLDILIQAPYKQAIIYLREGRLDKCRDKLIEAISLDELNLPALLLYCALLRFNGEHVLALDYYLEIIEKFGLRTDLAPPALVAAYKAKIEQAALLTTGSSSFPLRTDDDYYPVRVWCSPAGIVSYWEKRPDVVNRMLDVVFRSGKPQIQALRWNGTLAFSISERKLHIVTVTSRYAVIEQGDEYRIYRFEDGLMLPSGLSLERITALFRPRDESVFLGQTGYEFQKEFGWGGVNIKFSTYSRVQVIRDSSPVPGGRRIQTESRTEFKGGELIVSPVSRSA